MKVVIYMQSAHSVLTCTLCSVNFPQQHRWPHQAPFSDPVSTKEGGIFVKDENLDSPFFF